MTLALLPISLRLKAGNTPIHIACLNGQDQAMVTLLAAARDVTEVEVNSKGEVGKAQSVRVLKKKVYILQLSSPPRP
jgi:ankyrin repeat protein